jgi:hypothetical protein
MQIFKVVNNKIFKKASEKAGYLFRSGGMNGINPLL